MSKLDTEKQRRFKTNLILICVLFLITYTGIKYEYSPIVIIVVESALIGLSLWFILSMKKEGFGPVITAIMGCVTFILFILIPTDIPVATTNREIIKEYSLYVGLLGLVVGMILAYRPSLLYAKGRMPTNK